MFTSSLQPPTTSKHALAAPPDQTHTQFLALLFHTHTLKSTADTLLKINSESRIYQNKQSIFLQKKPKNNNHSLNFVIKINFREFLTEFFWRLLSLKISSKRMVFVLLHFYNVNKVSWFLHFIWSHWCIMRRHKRNNKSFPSGHVTCDSFYKNATFSEKRTFVRLKVSSQSSWRK